MRFFIAFFGRWRNGIAAGHQSERTTAPRRAIGRPVRRRMSRHDVGHRPLQLASKRRALLRSFKTQLRYQRKRSQTLTPRVSLTTRESELGLHLRAQRQKIARAEYILHPAAVRLQHAQQLWRKDIPARPRHVALLDHIPPAPAPCPLEKMPAR